MTVAYWLMTAHACLHGGRPLQSAGQIHLFLLAVEHILLVKWSLMFGHVVQADEQISQLTVSSKTIVMHNLYMQHRVYWVVHHKVEYLVKCRVVVVLLNRRLPLCVAHSEDDVGTDG